MFYHTAEQFLLENNLRSIQEPSLTSVLSKMFQAGFWTAMLYFHSSGSKFHWEMWSVLPHFGFYIYTWYKEMKDQSYLKKPNIAITLWAEPVRKNSDRT